MPAQLPAGLSLNDTLLTACPPPFVDEADYPTSGGFVSGRACGNSPISPDVSCCLPCPIQAWVYTDSFMSRVRQANYIALISLVLCVFVLVSYIALPASKSHRHYLNSGLLAAVILYHVAITLPLLAGENPDVCYDDITPRDQGSSACCAATGITLVLGATGAVIWVFMRALWTHVRIVWDIHPGKKFMQCAWTVGIVLPVAFLAAVWTSTGLSFRMGATCVPKHENAMADFWSWMLVFAGLTGLTQIATTMHVILAYLRTLKVQRRRPPPKSSSGTSKLSGTTAAGGSATATSTKHCSKDSKELGVSEKASSSKFVTLSSQQLNSTSSSEPRSPLSPFSPSGEQTTWRNVRALLILQWRSLVISVVVMLGVVFFTVVFIVQDALVSTKSGNTGDLPAVQDWTTCLILTGGNAEGCRHLTEGFVLNETTILVCLIIVALTGTEMAVLLIRMDMLRGWKEMIRKGYRRCRYGRADPELPLTSLAALPLHVSSPLPREPAPVAQKEQTQLAPPTNTESDLRRKVDSHNSVHSKADSGGRQSWFKRMSWRQSGFISRANWPLSSGGADYRSNPQNSTTVPENEVIGNDGDQALVQPQSPRSFWEDEEKDGEGVVLDPKAAWRGGLAMNPANPETKSGSISQRSLEPSKGG